MPITVIYSVSSAFSTSGNDPARAVFQQGLESRLREEFDLEAESAGSSPIGIIRVYSSATVDVGITQIETVTLPNGSGEIGMHDFFQIDGVTIPVSNVVGCIEDYYAESPLATVRESDFAWPLRARRDKLSSVRY